MDEEKLQLQRRVQELSDKARLHLRNYPSVLQSLTEHWYCCGRRAYNTLKQHVLALEVESKDVLPSIMDIYTDIVNPAQVSQEVGAIFLVSAEVWGVHELLRLLRPISGRLSGVGQLAMGFGVLYIGWRLSRRVVGGIAYMINHNRAAKRRLKQEWSQVQDRIDIMRALLDWKDAQGRPMVVEIAAPVQPAIGATQPSILLLEHTAQQDAAQQVIHPM